MTKKVIPPSSYRDPFLPTLAAVGIGVMASVGLSACMGTMPVDRSRHVEPASIDDEAVPSQVSEEPIPDVSIIGEFAGPLEEPDPEEEAIDVEAETPPDVVVMGKVMNKWKDEDNE